jgi:hypothetical protein
VSAGIFLRIVDTEKVLAEHILVQILGHAGQIPRSYLSDLCDHDIQKFYRGGRGLRIYFSRALFGGYNTQNCRVLLFTYKSLQMRVKCQVRLSGVYHR